MQRSVAVLAAMILGLAGTACTRTPAAPQAATPSPTPELIVPSSSGTLSLMKLRMVSATTAWALATPGEGHGLGHLVRTTNGGDRWNAIGLPSSLNSPNLEAVDVHDESRAWVLVMLGAESTASHELAVVATTADAGLHWSATPSFRIDGHGTGIQFVDALHGWVFATPGAGGAIGAGDTTLYRTIDGGAHWQAIKPPSEVRGDPSVVAGLPEACPMGGPIGQPVFADTQTGWLGSFCNQPALYRTRDGGTSWSHQTIPSFPGNPPSAADAPYLQYNVDSIQRLSATEGYFVLHRGVTTGANALQAAAIYLTQDAGGSWTAFRLPAAELAADFVDPFHGWMIGAGPGGDTDTRSLYGTQDGGRTWRYVDGPASFFDRELSFGDPATGLIPVQAVKDMPPQLLRTTDGGKTWGRLAPIVG